MAVKEGKTRVTVTLDAEQLERVETVALEIGGNLSESIRWIIRDQRRLRSQLEHLATRYDVAVENAKRAEQERADMGQTWGEGSKNGESFAYEMAATDLRLLLI